MAAAVDIAQAYRNKPQLLKYSFESETSQYHVALSAMRGWRQSMEDSHLIDVDFDGEDPTGRDVGIFGVFDGHGGQDVALFASRGMGQWVRQSKDFVKGDIKSALEAAYMRCDEELRVQTDVKCEYMGSTACVVAVTPTDIVCANVGDSRAILVTGSDVIALSTDHKALLPAERARVEASGLHVTGNGRVNGQLAMSRALGDFVFKPAALEHEAQGVTCFPSVTVRRRDRDNDDFLVVACDGIWDCLRNEEVAAFVREEMSQHSDGSLVCENLCRACVASRVSAPVGTDNMTMLLIRFKRESTET